MDEGAGVVWAGDARDGFNGGGEFTRWVVTEEDRADALDFFAPRCDRVRVMPFLDGVPCSIHGTVLPDGTAAYRPVELAILRGAGRRFVYGGRGTTWDPRPADRDHMRDLVRRTGEHLRARVGYRGSFGIDGVMTSGRLPADRAQHPAVGRPHHARRRARARPAEPARVQLPRRQGAPRSPSRSSRPGRSRRWTRSGSRT